MGEGWFPGQVSDKDLLVTVDSNAGAPSRYNESEPGTHEIHVLGAPWDVRVAGISYHSSPEA